MADNEKPRNGHFILFPLSLIQGFIQDPCVINRIAGAGIYISSRKQEGDIRSAIYLFIGFWHKWGSKLGPTMSDWFHEMEDSFPIQEKLIGSNIVDFEAGKIICDISNENKYIETFAQNHADFAKDLMEWYLAMRMIHSLNLSFNVLTITFYEIGKTSMKDHPEYENDPLIALDGELLRSMQKTADKSTPELRARWAMYLGMLSIIGIKQIAETTSIAIKSRMFGAKDAETLQEILKNENTQKLYDYWTSRRHYEGLLAEIEYSHKIKSQGVGRRTYISYRYKDDEDFVMAISKGSVRRQMACAKKSRKELLDKIKNSEKKKNV